MKTKTEVRHEHGDWIVFVDDNPQFGFDYKGEAERVRYLIDILIEVYESDIMDNGMTLIGDRTWNKMYEVLGKAGCEL